MSNYETQRSIVEAIKSIVDSELSKSTTTNSQIGFIQSDPVGFDCKVVISEQVYSCQLPEHLHTWIQKDDIVIVQDLYGDGAKKIVTGKVGQKMQSPSLVFFDEEKGKNISGVDMVYDEKVDKKIDTHGTI